MGRSTQQQLEDYSEQLENLKKAWVRLRLELMAQNNILPGEFDTFDELLMEDE